ncbi:hypothetical protein UlMin_003562 [Ulmus minor]
MNTLLTTFLFLISIFLLLTNRRRSSKGLPPGSLGIPIIGQSLSLLRAMRANTAEEWLENRIRKYGPISKLTLFSKPTVFLHGHDANKFIFTSDDGTIASEQTKSIHMILGDRNLLGLNGEDQKRVRGVLMLFLKPESLKQYVGKMELEIKKHLEMHWQGKQQVTGFQQMIEGMWSVPINFPFTRYNQQEEMAKSKAFGEFLTWEDLAKMKFTWRVAMETLRVVPPVFGGFKKAVKDIEYGGYIIPKGWQKISHSLSCSKRCCFVTSNMSDILGDTNDHMDNNIYPEPSKFDPNRFENQAATPPFSFMFARIETLITMQYLFTRFTWMLQASNSFKRDPMPVPHQGLPVQIT